MSSFFSMLDSLAESMGIKSSWLILIVAFLLIAIALIGVRLVSRKKTRAPEQKAPNLPPPSEHQKAHIVEPPKAGIQTKKVEAPSQGLPPAAPAIPSGIEKLPAKVPGAHAEAQEFNEPRVQPIAKEHKKSEVQPIAKEHKRPEVQPIEKEIKEPEPVSLARETKEPAPKPAARKSPDVALALPRPAASAPLAKRESSPLPASAPDKSVHVDLVGKEEPRSKGLGSALQNTRSGFMAKLSRLFSRSTEINDDDFEEMEAILFTADIGAKTAQKLLDGLRTRVREQKISGRPSMEAALKEEMRAIFKRAVPKGAAPNGSLSVYMFIGVNGAGKTTSIGKLGAQLAGSGKKVFFGAGDTFRAAAVKQLVIWGERAGIPVVTGKENADSASVLFDAITEAKKAKADVVLCDTAGRLHTKMGLMDELKKVHRVMSKAENGAPHEVFLVIDATMGQNAIAQAREFAEATPLTGVVLSKLDGTAKGGVALGIVDELEVPIRFVGIGEQALDLKPFDADEFVDALFCEN